MPATRDAGEGASGLFSIDNGSPALPPSDTEGEKVIQVLGRNQMTASMVRTSQSVGPGNPCQSPVMSTIIPQNARAAATSVLPVT